MQDEVNEKTVSLCIRCGKVTANLLKTAMKKALITMYRARGGESASALTFGYSFLKQR